MSECEAEGPWGRCEEYKGHDRWPDREREHVVWERGVNWSTEYRWWGPLDLSDPRLANIPEPKNHWHGEAEGWHPMTIGERLGSRSLNIATATDETPPPVPPLHRVPHLDNIYPGWPTPWQLWERLMSKRSGGRS